VGVVLDHEELLRELGPRSRPHVKSPERPE
jgi:hypothetical protein